MKRNEIENGIVVRIKGAHYYVTAPAGMVRCALRGRFRLGDSPEEVLPVVGDNVEFRWVQGRDASSPTGLIVRILTRKTLFVRSGSYGKRRYRVLGANLDHAFLVFAVKDPELNERLLDRMLVAAECGGMEPVICINKMDLADDPNAIRAVMKDYQVLAYRIIYTSVVNRSGLNELRDALKGNESIMVGPSGGGKTSLVKALQPGLELKIGHVSNRTGKGRHTTTHFELHRLDFGGYLGDTPGVREFGIWGISKEMLGDYFRDFGPFLGQCRFTGCSHSHEPGCAVKEAVGGRIAKKRYESYLRIMETLPDTLPKEEGG
ncbi:MAG: ribosome small subunit-dependent GTPase A [bacterium]|nr:MAG: ribosome small subunit-dependent GTPase A [bacterium]